VASTLISTLGSWEADQVTLAQVDSALSGLRRHEERAAVRTGVLSLVCVVPARGGGPELVLDTVEGLGARHPARTLVIVTEEEGTPGIDASATVRVVEVGEREVCYEVVVLRVRGPARFHLDAIIRPLTLPDLPVVIWTPTELAALGDPMLGAGNRMLIDTRAVTDPGRALPHAAKLLRHIPITDLSWVRLAPWRNLLAGLFQGSVNRPYLSAIDGVSVSGHFAPRHLIAGWLVSRLGVGVDVVELAEADHVSIVLRSGRSSFSVSRPTDEQMIEARVDLEDGPSWTQSLRMRDHWPSRALADALTQADGGDDAYRDAMGGALRLLA
jgi:glucose-6-phosphate dehydrogenase assembly protein OpcA